MWPGQPGAEILDPVPFGDGEGVACFAGVLDAIGLDKQQVHLLGGDRLMVHLRAVKVFAPRPTPQ